MHTDEGLIRQVIKMFEEKTGWGRSEDWTNQDFLQLSEMIRDSTGIAISHVTLKRVWGKVKYDSLPNTHTLNTLAQYLGYDGWRDLAAKNTAPEILAQNANPVTLAPNANPEIQPLPAALVQGNAYPRGRRRPFRRIWLGAPILVIIILAVLIYLHGQQPPPQPQDFSFTSKTVVAAGLPNSVIFDYDATRAPSDSVVIQQSWDTTRRVRVPRTAHQYTSIYYYPDFYHATLRIDGRAVKTHSLLIKTDGWLPLIEQEPVPVYFKPEDAIRGGRMGLAIDQIHEKNVPLQPAPPTVMYTNVRDFGEIYSDHFTFETSVRDEYAEGSAACQLTHIYLLCEGTAIWVPLCAKGCVSNSDLYFTYFYTSGKREDLSNFGVDFSKYVKLRIESDSGRARIFVNGQLAYLVPRHIRRSKIIGIDYTFQGTGSVDYVYLSNGKTSYRDDFNIPSDSPLR